MDHFKGCRPGDAAKKLIRLYVMPHGMFGTHIIVPFVFNPSGDPFPAVPVRGGASKP